MNPVTKTLLIILGIILSVFAVPAILIIFHDYIYAFIAIISFVACLWLFGYYSYQEIYPEIMRKHLEEEQVIARFNGDKDKIRRYHGFKKHFDGELTLEQLEKWFLHLDKHH
jgi:hypothetical protein